MGRSPEVDAWFDAYENPMKPVVQRVREVVLASDARMDECIKWKAPIVKSWCDWRERA
jgi:hypothetical protein